VEVAEPMICTHGCHSRFTVLYCHLRENDQLLSIQDEISPETDIGAAACALHKFGTSSAASYFDKIKGYTNARITTNIHGSWPNHALMLGMDKTADSQKQFFEFVKRYKTYPGELEFKDNAL
jgi:vanillate/4-hydroxybenzoate decarboxylase subunit C